MRLKACSSGKALPRIEIVSRGWEHTAWGGLFYPDDLPPDWRLTYYANEFSAVLVPGNLWWNAGRSLISDWLEDVTPGFQFYLEIRPAAPVATARLQALAQGLGGHFGGFLRRGTALEIPGSPSSTTLYALSMEASLDGSGQISSGVVEGPVAAIAASDRLGSLREQRATLDWLAGSIPPDSVLPLFLEGRPPSIQAIQDLRQLAELMDLA